MGRKESKQTKQRISGDLPVQWSKSNYATLKEGIIGNIYVKLYEIKISGLRGDVI